MLEEEDDGHDEQGVDVDDIEVVPGVQVVVEDESIAIDVSILAVDEVTTVEAAVTVEEIVDKVDSDLSLLITGCSETFLQVAVVLVLMAVTEDEETVDEGEDG